MLNRDEIDIKCDAKDQFPENSKAEVIFSEMVTEVAGVGEWEDLPVKSFARVQEMFGNMD